MGYISTKDWTAYIRQLAKLNDKAAAEMTRWVKENGFGDTAALIAYSQALATKYGEASAALSAQMYDAIAALEGKFLPAAAPAATATYKETAQAVQGALEKSRNENLLGSVVGRLVKQAGADTMLQNARRDGAQYAWVPSGETCAYCLKLASHGWQKASAKSKSVHAPHIHANCNCNYVVRFSERTNVRGYDPAKWRKIYDDAPGGNAKAKLNAMRREFYEENDEKINAQKRSAYAKRREREASAAEEAEA